MDLEPPDLVEENGHVLDRKTGITMWLRGTPELETKAFNFCDPRWRPEAFELTASVVAVLPDGSIDYNPKPHIGTWGFSLHLGGAELRDYLLTLDSNRDYDSPYFDDLNFGTFKRLVEPALRILGSHAITTKPHEMAIHFAVWRAYDKVVNERSDALAARIRAAGISIDRIETNPWLEDFVRKIPGPLPPSYAAFVRRYRFDPFRWDRLALLGTSGRHPTLDLPTFAAQGNKLWTSLLEARLVQIGLPSDRAVNPICFDMRRRSYMDESNVVVVDVAESLRTNTLMFKPRIAESFYLYAGAMLASDLQPVPIVPA